MLPELFARHDGGVQYETVAPHPLDCEGHGLCVGGELVGAVAVGGRHLEEGRDPDFEEAELVATVASGISTYLTRRGAIQEPARDKEVDW